MHFFTYGQDFAAVENAEQAAKYAAAGWRAATVDEFVDAWEQRDARDLVRMRAEVKPVTAPIKSWMPAGYMRFHV